MLSEIIKAENIILNLESAVKDELFYEMVETAVRHNRSINREEAVSVLEEREKKLNTCVAAGVAVPHGNCDSVSEPVLVIGISPSGMDYEVVPPGDALYDDSKVHVVLMILFNKNNPERHLKILSDCAKILQEPDFVRTVVASKSAEDVCNAIRNLEVDF